MTLAATHKKNVKHQEINAKCCPLFMLSVFQLKLVFLNKMLQRTRFISQRKRRIKHNLQLIQ